MDLYLVKDHFVVRLSGKYYIVDTGSPCSFSYDGPGEIGIGGRSFRISAAPANVHKSMLDELTGGDVNGLIGTDILGKTGLTVDRATGSLDFTAPEGEPGDGHTLISFEYSNGLLVTDDLILGRPLKNAIIDTGAVISYAAPGPAALLERTGEPYRDLSPTWRGLEGEYLSGELILPGRQEGRRVKVGLMPRALEVLGIYDAIIGPRDLSDGRIVFDFIRQEIRIYP